MRFGTWNIRSLAIPGKIDILNDELESYQMDLVALQESKWPYCGKVNTKSYQILYSGCNEGRHYAGVGFAIKKALLESVIKFNPISERISTIRLKGRIKNISVVTFYAPTEEKEDDIKDTFYSKLEDTINNIPRYDMKIILGDANAKVGKESIWRSITGKESLHDVSNDNGIRLLSFANSHNLFVASTSFPRKDIHKQTWKSPDERTINQIDHVLIDGRHKSSVMDVKSLRGAECGTDHFLVLAKIRQKLKLEKREKHNVDKIIHFEPENVERFKLEIYNRFDPLEVDDTRDEEIESEEQVEKMWTKFKTSIKEATKSSFSNKKPPKNKWFNEECRKMVIERKKAKARALSQQTTEAEEQYRRINRETTRILRTEKRKYINSKIIKAEEDRSRNNAKDFHRTVRFFQKGYQPRVFGIRGMDGTLVSEKQKVLNTWKDYFEDLLNCEEVSGIGDEIQIGTENTDEAIDEPTREEVKNVVKSLKNGKAPGGDMIPVELIKNGGPILEEYLYRLIVKIWRTEKIPVEWQEAVIVPIHKKGDKLDCKNYRGISLLSTTYKILSKIILSRIEKYVASIVGEHQAGFMAGRSTTDQIFILKEIASKYWEYNKDLYILFVDFAKAYDSISRQKMWKLMEKHRIPKKLVNLTKMCTFKTISKVKVENEYSDTFRINTGLRQGDALSPLLFNLVIEEALREVSSLQGGAKINGKTNVLAFADDVALIAENKKDIKELAEKLITETQKVGLKINEEKTKIMKISRLPDNQPDLEVLNFKFTKTDNFKYLGVTITSENRQDDEIQCRLAAAQRCYWSLTKLFRSRLLTRRTKIKMYKVIIQPVLLYGAEVWTLTKQNEKKLIVFENKILRRVFGPINDNGEWRIRKNQELRELYKDPDIIAMVKSRRLRWLGHVYRRDVDSRIKRVWMGQPEGRRPLGRPRLRWSDQVRQDLRRLGASLETAEDRQQWRHIVGEAKNHLGFVWPQE